MRGENENENKTRNMKTLKYKQATKQTKQAGRQGDGQTSGTSENEQCF